LRGAPKNKPNAILGTKEVLPAAFDAQRRRLLWTENPGYGRESNPATCGIGVIGASIVSSSA
jgi:hypothetical protein